jgi:hypothetical protein
MDEVTGGWKQNVMRNFIIGEMGKAISGEKHF